VRSRANLRDADERLRLARWCHLYGLREEGLAEAKAALALRPGSGEAARLVRMLERPAVEATASEAAAVEAEPPAPPDLTMETLSQYVCKVQPILMNACVNCHAGERGGDFRLVRSYELAKPHARSTQRNLTAVLRQIDTDDPASSPLLHKALSVHGGLAQAPLKGRTSPAYRTLEEWVYKAAGEKPRATATRQPAVLPAAVIQTAGAMPVLVPVTANAPTSSTVVSAATTPAPVLIPVASAAPATFAAPNEAKPAKPATGPSSESKWAAERTPSPETAPKRPASQPVDPFDPAEFNRAMHPDREAKSRSPAK
jgi:hypothetical protein